MKRQSFSAVARICALKTLYHELIEKATVPTKRKVHNIENAAWFIKSGHIFNKNNNMYNQILEICNETLKIKNDVYVN